MDRRVTQLIKKIRQRTGNYESGSNITDDEIIDSINDAQESLTELLMGAFNRDLFRKTDLLTLVSDQYEYSFPDDIYDNNFEMMEHSTSANPQEYDWSRVRPIHPHEKNLVVGYYIRNGKLVFPYDSGTARRYYIGKPVRVDKRRGDITSLSPLTIANFDTDEDLSSDDFISIVDKDGVIKAYNIYITNFNSVTGVITTTSDLTGASIGDYVVMGKKSSSHSEFSNKFERYLRTFPAVDLEMHDSNTDFQLDSAKLQKMEDGISDQAYDSRSDIFEVAMIDY